MSLLLDTWQVLQTDRLTVLLAFGGVLWGSLVVAGILIRLHDTRLDLADLFAISLGAWIVPVLFCSILVLLLGLFLRLRPSSLLIAASLLGAAACALWSILRAPRGLRTDAPGTVLGLAAIFLVLAILRLAFVSRTLLPMYFDSAEHYRIIRLLMDDYSGTTSPAALAWPVQGYYHIGYHSVLAAIAVLSQADLGRLILVSGQIAAAALPIPLFVIVGRETASQLGGSLAVLLGALGWYMPAHALNWGKYPALFGVAVLVSALAAIYLAGTSVPRSPGRRGLLIVSLIGACAAFAIHTRLIILLAIMIGSWILSSLWLYRPLLQRLLLAGLVILVVVVECVLLAREPVLHPVLDPYLGPGIWITCLVCLLAPFAFARFPRLAFGSVLSVGLLLLGMFIPGPGLASGPLLDRPLVEMVLFIPLALAGAAGAVALASIPGHRYASAPALIITLFAAGIVEHASLRYSFYPSSCCLRVGGDDLTALAWLADNPAPGPGRVLIPTVELRDSPLPYPPLHPASDAGAWVGSLTRRQTAGLPYGTDFGNRTTLESLCTQDVTDIFVSSDAQAFSEASLQETPAWYIMELRLPGVVLYRVTGCDR